MEVLRGKCSENCKKKCNQFLPPRGKSKFSILCRECRCPKESHEVVEATSSSHSSSTAVNAGAKKAIDRSLTQDIHQPITKAKLGKQRRPLSIKNDTSLLQPLTKTIKLSSPRKVTSSLEEDGMHWSTLQPSTAVTLVHVPEKEYEAFRRESEVVELYGSKNDREEVLMDQEALTVHDNSSIYHSIVEASASSEALPTVPQNSSDPVKTARQREITNEIMNILNSEDEPPQHPEQEEAQSRKHLNRVVRLTLNKFKQDNNISPDSAGSRAAISPEIEIPDLCDELHAILEEGNDDRIHAHFGRIMKEIAQRMQECPLFNRKQYKEVGLKFLEKYPAIGSSALVDKYRAAKWRQLGNVTPVPDDWPGSAIEKMKEAKAKKGTPTASSLGMTPDGSADDEEVDFKGPDGKRVRVIDFKGGYGYFNYRLSSFTRNTRQKGREAEAVTAALQISCGDWKDIFNLWPKRVSMSTKYTGSDAAMEKKLSIEMAKEHQDMEVIRFYFEKSFAFRTALLTWPRRQMCVLQHFPLFQHSKFVFLEAEIMLGLESYKKFQDNATCLFKHMQKLHKAKSDWRGFLFLMRNLAGGSCELSETMDINKVNENTAAHPSLLCYMNADSTVRQAIILIKDYKITGLRNWEEGVKAMILCLLIFGYDMKQRSQAVQFLATALFGLSQEKLCTRKSQKILAALKAGDAEHVQDSVDPEDL